MRINIESLDEALKEIEQAVREGHEVVYFVDGSP